MPTTVTKTIGATSSPTTPDYTSLASWIAACPANLVTADQIWEGQCLDQGEFTDSGTLCTISGITTDSTRFVRLTCATGASFRDKAGVRTTALDYNASNGVAIRNTAAYGMAISINSSYAVLDGLQIKGHATGGQAVDAIISSGEIKNCILVGGNTKIIRIRPGTSGSSITNCLIRSLTAGSTCVSLDSYSANTVQFCTIIGSNSGDTGIKAAYVSTNICKNTAIFNCASVTGGSGGFTSSGNNATDAASAPGTSNQTSLTYSSQFENTASDWRAKSTGSLPNNGVTISGISVDISKTTRSGSTPTIGAWEVTASGYTLTASAAAFTEIGQTVAFLRALRVAASTASFAETGTAASLLHGRLVAAASGTFTNSGAAVALPVTRRLSIAAGSFGFSGIDAALSASTKNLVVGSGTFDVSSLPVSLPVTRAIAAAAASFSQTGGSVNLVKNQTLVVSPGSFSVTGASAGLLRGWLMSAGSTSFQLVGYNAGLYGPGEGPSGSGYGGLILRRAQQ